MRVSAHGQTFELAFRIVSFFLRLRSYQSGAKQGTAVSGTTGNTRKLHLGADDRNITESSFFVLALHVAEIGKYGMCQACSGSCDQYLSRKAGAQIR